MRLVLTSEENNITCVACDGEICQSQFPTGVSNPLEALLSESCYGRRVIMDLGEATFIDSSGVGWLMACQKRFSTSGGRLILHSVPPMIDQVLRLLRLHTLLTITADLTAARAVAAEGRGQA